jgi:hypothetical protein
MNFSVQHSYYWRRGGHLKSTKTEASAKLLPMHPSLRQALLEWRSQSLYNQPNDFVFPSERLKGSKPLDLASVLKKKIQPAFRTIGIIGVGFSAHGRVHAGGHGRTLTHDPRLLASQQSARNQQVSSGNDEEQALGAGKAGGCRPARGWVVGKQVKPNPAGPEELVPVDCLDAGHNRRGPERLLDPNGPGLFLRVLRNHSKEWRGRRDSNPRPLP